MSNALSRDRLFTERESGIDLSCDGCNVLFLNIELLRADRVGLLNPDYNSTPNIDSFFNKSIVFEQASSPSGMTYYSMASVFTATEAMLNKHNRLRLKHEDKLLIDYFPTIPEVLAVNGYSTVGINRGKYSGKNARWHPSLL